MNMVKILAGSPLLPFLQERLAERGRTVQEVSGFAISNETEEGPPEIDENFEEWVTHRPTGYQTWTLTFADGQQEVLRFHKDDVVRQS